MTFRRGKSGRPLLRAGAQLASCVCADLRTPGSRRRRNGADPAPSGIVAGGAVFARPVATTIQQRSDIDILIVGAGPVGLFLASECARRGLRWRLVESHASQSVHSKALAIFPRTLEILDMAGLVDPFLRVANRVESVGIVSHGRRLAQLRFAPDNSPYPFIAMVPQNVTERLLAGRLEGAGGKIEYNTALVSAVDRGSHVVATLDRRGERVDVRATFVVGCDGAHSTVRHLLNLPSAGGEYEDTFMLADVETNDALPADELLLCPSEFGPVAIFPMSATRRRIVAIVPRIEGDAPSLDLVREILEQRAPAEIEALASIGAATSAFTTAGRPAFASAECSSPAMLHTSTARTAARG